MIVYDGMWRRLWTNPERTRALVVRVFPLRFLRAPPSVEGLYEKGIPLNRRLR